MIKTTKKPIFVIIVLMMIAFVIDISFEREVNPNVQMAQTTPTHEGSPINIGTRNCVCKGNTCQDANFISFRKWCGHSQSGTDLECGMESVNQGRCD